VLVDCFVFRNPHERNARKPLMAILMRHFIYIALLFLTACKPQIDIDNIEQRENGLSYIKGTNQLVDGEVVRKFENGKIGELHNFKNGKPIGNWYTYGDNGKILSHGFGVDARKYEKKLGNVDLANSFLSLNQTGDFTYLTFYLGNKELFENPNLMVSLSKEVFDEYSLQYKLEDIFLYDKEHEYTISKSATLSDRYKIDTVNRKDKKVIFIK
jgi:hypothetical protein